MQAVDAKSKQKSAASFDSRSERISFFIGGYQKKRSPYVSLSVCFYWSPITIIHSSLHLFKEPWAEFNEFGLEIMERKKYTKQAFHDFCVLKLNLIYSFKIVF